MIKVFTINNDCGILKSINKKFIYGKAYDKIYDKTTSVVTTISGLIYNDTVNYSASFESFNVKNNINVNLVLNTNKISTSTLPLDLYKKQVIAAYVEYIIN